MFLPNKSHLFNWDTLCLGEEFVDENAHHKDEKGEEDEHSKFHVTKHSSEDLSYCESEDHVHRNVHTLKSWSNFKRKDFTWNQPSQWPPWPCKPCNVGANEQHHCTSIFLRQSSAISIDTKFVRNHNCNHNLGQQKQIKKESVSIQIWKDKRSLILFKSNINS